MSRQDVRRAGEQLRAADADFSACVAARSSCERELALARMQLRARRQHDCWRHWRAAIDESSELRSCVADAKARHQQARESAQSAWEQLRDAKSAYMRALVAHNATVRQCAAGVEASGSTCSSGLASADARRVFVYVDAEQRGADSGEAASSRREGGGGDVRA